MSIRGERIIITLLGKRNVGKSSLINAITNQEIAIVSATPGTTTDPVAKRYELVPIGPVTLYDTAGLDDVGELGEKRVQSTFKVLFRTDIAILVSDGLAFEPSELEMIERLRELKISFVVAFNQMDLRDVHQDNVDYCEQHQIKYVRVSSTTKEGVDELKDLLISLAPKAQADRILAGDLVERGARVILVTPIDASAPKGRMILPQMQTVRDLLDHHAIVTFCQPQELEATLKSFEEPVDLVITDSQAVKQVERQVPQEIALTTFSILFARYKGELETMARGVRQIDKLKDGDKVLIAEACSHHAQEDDIGTVKIPKWLMEYTKKDLIFEAGRGYDYPANLEDYQLIIHCGGCMLNQAEMMRRIVEAERRGVPITNYGLAITKVQGVFERCVKPLGI